VDLPETRFAWNGDMSLAYQSLGEGQDLLYLPGGVSNVDVMWEGVSYARLLRRLAAFSRLIVMDRRGTGCSDRFSPNQVAPLEVGVDDAIAVLDEVSSERAAVFAFEEATFIAAMLAAARPDRISHLILLDPAPAWVRDDEITWEWTRRRWDEQIAFFRDTWGRPTVLASDSERVIPSIEGNQSEIEWLARFQRLTQSPGVAAAETRRNCDIDIRGVLGSIHIPTLILHRIDDAIVDIRSARYVADHIDGALFVEIPGADHIPFWENTEELAGEIEQFLTGVRLAPEIDLVLATVLFTDIVGSTEKQAAMGDREWKRLVEHHHSIMRESLSRYRGVENDTAGDGFFATFDGPARAIRCAQEVAARLREIGLQIRAGVHIGECERIDTKVAGLAVTIGARISAIAGVSEILVSQTVKDLVAGSGLAFEDAGDQELKGVPDRWHLYRVIENAESA
jgi:class 3 adenylate cyclase